MQEINSYLKIKMMIISKQMEIMLYQAEIITLVDRKITKVITMTLISARADI